MGYQAINEPDENGQIVDRMFVQIVFELIGNDFKALSVFVLNSHRIQELRAHFIAGFIEHANARENLNDFSFYKLIICFAVS